MSLRFGMFARDGYRFRDIPVALMPYNSGPRVSRVDNQPHDSRGARMHVIDGRQYDHPVSQANYGLLNLAAYRDTRDPFFLKRAVVQGERLMDTAVQSRGAWYFPYPYDFRLGKTHAILMAAPWYSALAQGKALSLFVRLKEMTGDPRWEVAANRTFLSFTNPPAKPAGSADPVDSGEVPSTVSVTNGLLSFDEYARSPRPYFTFNGHMSALMGIWDYYRTTRNQVALALFDGGVTTIGRLGPTRLRKPGWFSRYGTTEDTSLRFYHGIHGGQLVTLWQMTGDDRFVRLADQLRDDYPLPELPGNRLVELSRGVHVGYRFDSLTGRILKSKQISLDDPAAEQAVRRSRISGRSIYYLMSGGSLDGWWIEEKRGRAMLRGLVAVREYIGPRPLRLAPGTYHGRGFRRFEVSGKATATYSAPVTLPVTMTAWIDGKVHAFVTAGPLARTWIPMDNATFE